MFFVLSSIFPSPGTRVPDPPNYQLLFVTPAMSPVSACSRKHSLQSANFRM